MQSESRPKNMPVNEAANVVTEDLVVSAHAEPRVNTQLTAERLCQMAEQMEMFLTKQIDRLENELRDTPPKVPDQQEYQHLFDEFQEVRRKWEMEREEQQERLANESQRLVEAWQKLEAEQRETLRQRVLKTANTDVGNANPLADGSLAPQRISNQRNTGTVDAPGADSKLPTSRNGQIPFQQLRREILQHARQRRKR